MRRGKKMEKLKLADLKDVKIKDPFWDRHTQLVKSEILDYQWRAMNDQIEDAPPSHCIENFRIAAGESDGEFFGAVFQDSDVAKWLEAVAYTLAAEPDAELKKRADGVIDLIGRAQQPDGYFNTYFILKEPGKRFQNLCEGHELYTLGHMIEAAVAYNQATGERRFLEIVCRMADLVADIFGPEEGKLHGMPGHEEIELALVRLYEVTGEKKYLETAKYFIDVRGTGEKNYFLKEMEQEGFRNIFPEFEDYQPEYSQSHLPVREQRTAEGHAVRAVYLYSAMADLADLYHDEKLFEACTKLWDNIVQRRMYVTGGIGSSGILERFTTDYDLPNDCNYGETCASIGLAMFGRRMAQITRDARYIDVAERALYNTVLAGIALDGKSFFYVNPLEVWPDNCMGRTSKEHVKSIRQKWFGVACCPPNIARTLSSLGQYIYGYDKHTLFVNLFIGNETELELEGGRIRVSLETEFPYKNTYSLRIHGEAGRMTLALRIPDYAVDYRIFQDGTEAVYTAEKGYAYISGDFSGKTLEVRFRSEPRFIRANPAVRADEGKVCMMNGPLVYALEEADNGANLSGIYLDTSTRPAMRLDPELFGGTWVLSADGYRIAADSWAPGELYKEEKPKFLKTEVRAIPYAYWNNRGKGEMTVWVKEWI